MAESWTGLPERPRLRRAIRHGLRTLEPSIRIVAEGFLAEASAIDLLGVGAEGEMVSLRIGRDEDDRALLTRSLSDLAWLRPRLADFLKLAPGLGLEPSTEPRALIVCPEFSREIMSAIDVFPAGAIQLLRYRCLTRQGQLSVMLDPVAPVEHAEEGDREATGSIPPEPCGMNPRPDDPAPSPRPRLTDPPATSTFRTGLTEADLQLVPRDPPVAH
ncbi:MAG TPA: hypothetical protein ENI85_15990 [Deltaproteobacteria bacterium]|nr:hypothetical protein [Deltaproteobacteria bacterium]